MYKSDRSGQQTRTSQQQTERNVVRTTKKPSDRTSNRMKTLKTESAIIRYGYLRL